MKMKQYDIKKIIARYNLGEIKSFISIDRRLSTLNSSFIIKTSKGKFFLKAYTKQFKRFKYHILKGLALLIFLEKQNYPSIKVILARNNNPYITYNGITFAIFEFINIEEKRIKNKYQAYEIGKNLGKLHLLTRNFPISKRGQSYDSFKRDLNLNFYLSRNAPDKYKKILNHIREYYTSLKIPHSQPKSICHVEFTSQHVRFNKNKLIKVIDWDEVGKDYMFYDLGTTMAECFTKKIINFKILNSIIKGYESQRKLTKWERSHLFEALFFGISKFVIWGLDKEEIKKSGWNKIGLQEVGVLINMGKTKFYENLLK